MGVTSSFFVRLYVCIIPINTYTYCLFQEENARLLEEHRTKQKEVCLANLFVALYSFWFDSSVLFLLIYIILDLLYHKEAEIITNYLYLLAIICLYLE